MLFFGAAFLLVNALLLGPYTGGVYLNAPPAANSQPGSLPGCVSVHVFSSRGWGSWQTIHSQVDLSGCNTSDGQLRISSGPTCSASSFLGPGTASCSATNVGADIKVRVEIHYPYLLDWTSGSPSVTNFTINPSGNYSSP